MSTIYGILLYDGYEQGHALINDMPSDVVTLDILQDWIAEIQAAYDMHHAIVFPTTQGDNNDQTI